MKALLFSMSVLIIVGCQGGNYKNDIKIQSYFYKYIGFENSENMQELLNEVKTFHAKNDYVVTKNEQLISWNRAAHISSDTLHQLHQILHRLEPFNPDKKYKPGTFIIEIELLNTAKIKKPLFEFTRFTMGENDKAEDELNFGQHEIALSNDSWLANAPYLAEKFAQVSFK
ncbi:MAG: hypothetical protein JXQ87_11670 [Bacteroidia bacterium]